MIQKRTMIIFAVIAVIIVASPVSFYLLTNKDPVPEVPIGVSNSIVDYSWLTNFTASTNTDRAPIISNISALSNISEQGYSNSRLDISVSALSIYCPGDQFMVIAFLNFSGELAPNLKATGVRIIQNSSLSNLNETICSWMRYWGRGTDSNVTINSSMPVNISYTSGIPATHLNNSISYEVGLLNQTYSQNKSASDNRFSGTLSYMIFLSPWHPLSMLFHFTISAFLEGLSKPVLASVEINMIDE
ncbi:MAG: hypothetical protein M1327_02175 [Candidatus Thermoplasmatota archaeon]|nr:hypothetical protein [Candidatus Thermoplasmatota archaeon]